MRPEFSYGIEKADSYESPDVLAYISVHTVIPIIHNIIGSNNLVTNNSGDFNGHQF